MPEGLKKKTAAMREATGLDEEACLRLLAETARRLDITPELYLKYRFYEVPAAEQDAWLEEIRNRKEKDASRAAAASLERQMNLIEKLSLRTGWSLLRAEQAMEAAKDRAGITYREYLLEKMYLLSEEEQDKAHRAYRKQLRETRREEKESCLRAIMEYRGCGREEAEAELAEAREKMKISPRSYRRFRFFELPEDQRAERMAQLKVQIAGRSARKEDNDEFAPAHFRAIVRESGLDTEEVRRMVEKAERTGGVSWKDFHAFRLWEAPEDTWPAYYTRRMKAALMQTYDETATVDLCANKEYAMVVFDKWIGRKWGVSTEMSEEEFLERFKDCDRILYKPASNGSAGGGIRIFDMAEGPAEVYRRIRELPRGIAEEFVRQHEDLDRLYPNAVNTVRIVTVAGETEKGSIPQEVCYTALRIGSGGSAVDNFSMGGMVAAVDASTGKILTDAVNMDGGRFHTHPDTGTVIKGFQIPCFREALDLVLEAGKDLKGHIGWDVAISEKGPVLIEANTGPGNRILQMPYVSERKGMAYVMEKYLEPTGVYEEILRPAESRP